MGPYAGMNQAYYQQGYGSYYGNYGYGMAAAHYDASQMKQQQTAQAPSGGGGGINPVTIIAVLVLLGGAALIYQAMTAEGTYGKEGFKAFIVKFPNDEVYITMQLASGTDAKEKALELQNAGGKDFMYADTSRTLQFTITASTMSDYIDEPWIEDLTYGKMKGDGGGE